MRHEVGAWAHPADPWTILLSRGLRQQTVTKLPSDVTLETESDTKIELAIIQ